MRRNRGRAKVSTIVVALLCMGLVLAGCTRKASGDLGYENMSDLANAETTAEAFVASVQRAPFATSDGAAKFFITRDARGFVGELQVREAGEPLRRLEFGMHDILYNSRVQRLEGSGGEVRFLYEEFSFFLAASKKRAHYDGDPVAASRIYRVVVDSTGRVELVAMLRLVRDGAAVVMQLNQQP